MKQRIRHFRPAIALLVFLGTFALYVVTLAPSVVMGDPGEYQFVPHILGIAHPPGYAFFIISAKIWTSIVSIGSIAFRTNLLAAAAGAWTVTLAYQMVWLLNESGAERPRLPKGLDTETSHRPTTNSSTDALRIRVIAPLIAATILATSTDLWQHSIHANSHVISAALSATTLYAGLRWWATGDDRWLYSFAFLAALGVTHHPLLAFGAPAYVVFVLCVRPRQLRDWRRLGRIILSLLLGLSVFLYLPLRAGATPFGPSPNWDAIIGHATARGIRGNLFYYGLADQPVRLQVFWGLLRLQYSLPSLTLAIVGLIWLALRRRHAFILLGLFFAVNVAFTINTVQDVMAYLLLPFTTTAIFAGAGLLALFDIGQKLLREPRLQVAAATILTLILTVGPLTAAYHKAPRLSLRNYRLADNYIQAVFDQFAGKGEGAILLSPWESLTPLYYAQHVEGKQLDPADVKPVFVASGTANPWVEFVWKNIEEGPIYLADFRPQVVAEGFRLRPVGDWPFYKLEAPPATGLPEISHPLDLWAGEAIRVLGWDLDRDVVRAGETAYLTLYFSAPVELADYYMPFIQLGQRFYRWTTDSRLNTPWWMPDEIIVERYAVTVPFGTPPGDYPLALGVSNLSKGQDLTLSNGDTTITLATALRVDPPASSPSARALTSALANLNSQIALMGGSVCARGQSVKAPWAEPLQVQPGDAIQVWLDWQALTAVDQPYTVFVHLIDGAGQIVAQHDYTPMGGAFPTFLWIPRWIEGQRIPDPYKLHIPTDAPPGDYLIEIGMYGMTSLRRVYLFDTAGNLAGDRYVLGPVRISTP